MVTVRYGPQRDVIWKSVEPVQASERSKNDASVPMFTASSVLASTYACASSLFVTTLRTIEATRSGI